MATTMLANLLDPQVVADLVEKKLIDKIRFAPLADVDTTLVGRPGDTVTLPWYNYIGAADDLTEASAISAVALTTGSASVQIKEAGKAVEITDTAILSGYGRPYDRAAEQIVMSMADKLDKDLLYILSTDIASTMTQYTDASTSAIAVPDIAESLELFGEDIDGQKVLLCSPKLYTAIRNTKDWCPASEFAANALVRGAVGQIFGCDIIVTNRLRKTSALDEDAYIVKPGALRLFLKRDSLVETDRDILKRNNVISITKHYAAYLYNAANAIKLAVHS